MRFKLCLLSLMLAGVAASHVSANVFAADGRDPRHVQPRSGEAHAFAAIGVLRNNSPIAMLDDDDHLLYTRGEATAFLVSPCYAVTNYHAVFGEGSGPEDAQTDHSVTLSLGDHSGGRGFRERVRAVPAFWGDFSEDQGGQDWAVLRLDRCVGSQIGWLDLTPRSPTAIGAARLSIAGYPGDKDQAVLWRADGCGVMVRPRDVGLWSSDCAASPGSSGSPVFLIEDGGLRVVGIMEGADDDVPGVQRRYSASYANLVVDVSAILRRKEVRAAIKADIEAARASEVSPP
jgi:V8-like Glu-specific endopeptidase